MKKNRLPSLAFAMMSVFMLGVSACASNNNSSPNVDHSASDSQTQSTTVVPQTIKKLVVSKNPNKMEYEAGEKFDSTGLEISIVEFLDGEKISTTATKEYTLKLNGEAVTADSVIVEGDNEIIVLAKHDDIRSTSFVVRGVVTKQAKTLDAIFTEILTNNNFTVTNKIGTDNDVKGLVNDDAIYWTSSVEAYFSDEGYGYGTYNGDTFRFNIVNDTFKNAEFIKDLGPKAVDDGLWSSETVDEHADKRISNYNMRGLEKQELDDTLAYLKTVKPVDGNANKYLLDNQYVKWLFNLIGHTSLSFSPAYHLGSPDKIGGVKGEVFVEVKDNGLHVELVRKASYALFEPCSADITNIGTTVIPGKDAFLKNPHFGVTKTSLDLLSEAIAKQNYNLTSSVNNKNATFNQDYVYGDFLKDVDGYNFNALNVKENNLIEKESGFYQLSIVDNAVALGEMVNQMDMPYLTNYQVFNSIKYFFKEDSSKANRYQYLASSESETLSQCTLMLSLFGSASDESVINNATIDIELSEDALTVSKATFTFKYEDKNTDIITLTNFGEAKNIIIENYIKTIY